MLLTSSAVFFYCSFGVHFLKITVFCDLTQFNLLGVNSNYDLEKSAASILKLHLLTEC